MSRPIRRSLAAALLLLSLVPSLWFLIANRDLPHFGLLMDDALYLSGARSLAQGRGYRIGVLPGGPPQTKHPPALAWLISPIWRAAPSVDTAVPIAVLLLWICMGAWIFLSPGVFGQLGLSPPQALALAAIVAINPYVVFLSTCLLAEMPMLALLWLSMTFAAAAARRASRPLALASGLAAGLAFLFRTAALPILPALVIWFLLRRRRALALIALAAAIPFVAGWLSWRSLHRPASATPQLVFYLDYTRHWLNHIAETGPWALVQANLNSLVLPLGKLLWFDTGALPALVYARTALLVASLAGSFALLKNGISLLHLFTCGYAALILTWNFTPDERLALPLLPLLAAGACEAGSRVLKDARCFLMRSALTHKAAGAALVLVLASTLILVLAMSFDGLTHQMVSIPARERLRHAQLAPVLAYARQHLPSGEPILAFQEGRTSFQTGHPSIGLPLPTAIGYEHSEARVMNYFLDWPSVLRAHRVRYILLTPWDFELDLSPAQIRRYHQSVLGHPAVTVLHRSGSVLLVEFAPA